jgi:hypothetical protein
MKSRLKFDLTDALCQIFMNKAESQEELLSKKVVLEDILRETGLTPEELDTCVKAAPSQTIGNLKYRILAIMDKQKRDSSHII